MPVNKKQLKPRILELLGEGVPLDEICDRLGVSVRTVQDWNTKDRDFKALYSAVADRTADLKEKFVEVFPGAMGIVTDACKMVGISRRTYYNWINSDPEFAAACKDSAEVSLDFAEHKLFELIDEKNTAAVIFYLKTKGKDRGYVERHESRDVSDKPVEVSLSISAQDLVSDQPDADPSEMPGEANINGANE